MARTAPAKPPAPPRLRWRTAAMALALCAAAFGCHASRTAVGPSPRPSFVLILADDQSWNGTSVAMEADRPDSRNAFFETPSLERLAARGMVFSQAYAAAPNCSPTRASLLTGRSPAALHLTDILGSWADRRQRRLKPLETPRIASGLSPDDLTVAEWLKQRAPEYVTAHLGKWHLGGGGPGAHGFDVHSGDTDNHDGRGSPQDPKRVFELTDAAIRFLEERASDGHPFYLQVSHWAVHEPQAASPASLAHFRAKAGDAASADVALAAATADLDTGVGRILDALDRLGLARRTYVFYVSDNGGPTFEDRSNAPLRGGKDTLYEGGIRVPLLAAGPGIAAGSRSDVLTVSWDWLPTVAELAGSRGPLPDGIEGGSLTAVLRGEAGARVVRPRADLFWHLPHYFPEVDTTPVSSLRSGPFALLYFWEDGRAELYDLDRDLGETRDLATTRPAETARLVARLRATLAAVGAQEPVPRPE